MIRKASRRVLGSFPWYTQNWGEGEPEKGEGKREFSKSSHCNVVLSIRETKSERKNLYLENIQLLQKQNFLLQTLTSWSRDSHVGDQASQML